MRLLVKNKEEGTELFKGKAFRPAAARYQKALTHCAKFFDLTKEDEIEVKALKLSLYLNLAVCYTKLEIWEQVLRNCEDALTLDSNSIKALFRRSAYYENKKDWDKAMADIKQCQKLLSAAATAVNINNSSSESSSSNSMSAEEKAIAVAADRLKKQIQKEKDKEKKTWGKMFA